MKNNSENLAKTIASISRICLWLTIGSILLAILIGGVGKYLKSELIWLTVAGQALLIFILLMILIDFMVSSVLLGFGYPKLAYIWDQNNRLIRFGGTWEQLSPDVKKIFYTPSIAPMMFRLIFILLFVIVAIYNYTR